MHRHIDLLSASPQPSHPPRQKCLSWASWPGTGIGAAVLLSGLPAQAHQVKTTETIGATLHIEPNDTPRAGESSQAWFALTRQGGATVPLDQCDCQLAIYDGSVEPETAEDPLLTPQLVPTSAEGFVDIPSAEIEFPAVGSYTLVLSGKPTDGDAFGEFELAFEVTVATGRRAESPQPEPEATNAEPADPTTTADGPQTSAEAPAQVDPGFPLLQFSQNQWQKPAILVLLVLLVLSITSAWSIWQRSRSVKK